MEKIAQGLSEVLAAQGFTRMARDCRKEKDIAMLRKYARVAICDLKGNEAMQDRLRAILAPLWLDAA